jgi:3D (Asp-Asp-Asp) domain-containing protein
MRMPNTCTLPFRSLQRNRKLLACSTLVAASALAIASAALISTQPNVKPLLNIDEISMTEFAGEPSTAASTCAIEPIDESIIATLSQMAPNTDISDELAVSQDTSETNEIRWFNGRPLKPSHTMMMTVTAYSPDARSCGGSADGITASGYSVYTNGMKLVAADTKVLPFGSLITVPGYDSGHVVPVLDRGGAIKGNRLDVLFPTHEQAMQFGVKTVQVTVWDFADGQPSDYKPIYKAADSVVVRPTSANAG